MSTPSDVTQLEGLLEFLRETRGLDFTGYKRPSLSRRIHKRMSATGVTDFDDYRDYLEVHPEEQPRLVDTILINVTSFFRDEPAWKFLAEEVVPAIVDAKDPDEPIRAWSAGCASGEEACSLAMVLADHLGVDQFKARVKIFATDTDDAALVQGRRGIYTERQLEPVPVEKREKYFEAVPTGFMFRPDYRRSVIYGRNDITSDAPISRLDLLVCRNVLMYLVSETQRRVLKRFHYALAKGGYLFLGKAETVLAHADLFRTVSAPFRIFARAPEPLVPEPSLAAAALQVGAVRFGSNVLQSLALAATPVAQLVVDIDGHLVGANTKARAMFGVTTDDLGRSFWDLEVSYRPVQLRSQIEQAYAEAHPIVLHDVTRALTNGRQQFLEVTVAPLCDPAGINLGVSLTFADVTELGRMRVDLERSSRQLEAMNAELLAANEKLETSNEELQSANEELETMNEELQSANEELETGNEELRSGNEQLETMNEQLLSQTGQIERAERFLASILDSLVVGVAVVNDKLDVVIWNRAAEKLFGLRADETRDRSFLALDIGLPVGEIGPLLHAALSNTTSDAAHVTLDATNRRGQPFTCRVSVQRFANVPDDDVNIVVLMDPIPELPA